MVSAISILACHSSDPGRKRHSVGPEYTCGIGCSGRGLSAGRITDTSGSRGIRYVTLISYSLLMDVGVTDPVQVATPHRQRSWKLGHRLAMPATCWPIVRPRRANGLLAKERVPPHGCHVTACDPGE